jgi:hypothetical protein
MSNIEPAVVYCKEWPVEVYESPNDHELTGEGYSQRLWRDVLLQRNSLHGRGKQPEQPVIAIQSSALWRAASLQAMPAMSGFRSRLPLIISRRRYPATA